MSDCCNSYWKATRAKTDLPRDIAASRTKPALEGPGFHAPPGANLAEGRSRFIALAVMRSWMVEISDGGKGRAFVQVQHGLRATAATWRCLAAVDLTLTRMRLEAAFARAIAAWPRRDGVTTTVSEAA